jgi:hypothetical protein
MEVLLENGCFCVVRAEMLQERDNVRAQSLLNGSLGRELVLGGTGIGMLEPLSGNV